MPANSSSAPTPVVWIRSSSRADVIEELGLSYGLHCLSTIHAVHRAIFYTDGGNDIVSGATILNKFVQEIAVVGSLSQVVVRITNRQFGLQRSLGCGALRLHRCGCHVFSFTNHVSAPRNFLQAPLGIRISVDIRKTAVLIEGL